MDSTMNSAGGNSKQVDMRLLAGNKGGQHKWCKREMAHIPEPSTPPTKHQRQPMDQLNPLHCHGRLKMKSRRVS